MIRDFLTRLFAGITLPAPVRKVALAALAAAIAIGARAAYQWSLTGVFSVHALLTAIVAAVAALILSALGLAIPNMLAGPFE